MAGLPTTTTGTVAGAIIGITAIVLWILNRKSARDAKANEPGELNRTRKEEVAREVLRNDERGANASLDDDLRRYHELRNSLPGDRKRPGDSTGGSGANN